MSKKLKVGVVGVRGIARTHFPGWKDSAHAEMIALADVDKKILSQRGKEQDVDLLYNDPKDLFRNKDIDIIDICTPNAYHTPLAIAALKAGKHVICEKPLAPSPKDIRKMIAARDKSGKMLMTAQHFRFQAASQALKKRIDAGALGSVYHARSWMLRRSGAPTSPGFVQKKHSGGGPCIDIGVHILDLTLWMLGNPKPVSVSGVTQSKLAKQTGAYSDWGGPIPKFWDVEEFAAAMVRFDNGATLVLEVSWLLHHKTEGEDMQMWLYGEKGGAHWPMNEVLSTDNKLKQHQNTLILSNESGEPHALECMAFAEAVAKGKASPVPAEESLDVIAILDGLYRSAKSGKEVRLA
jgi:predicted dehydrogenase